MRTEDHTRSDANHIAWINLIQSNTAHCAKLGLMRAQESYIDTSTAQVTAPGLFGGFSFRDLKKLKGGDSWIHSTAQKKKHSKTEFGKKNYEKKFGESETFYRSRFTPATGVIGRFAIWIKPNLKIWWFLIEGRKCLLKTRDKRDFMSSNMNQNWFHHSWLEDLRLGGESSLNSSFIFCLDCLR